MDDPWGSPTFSNQFIDLGDITIDFNLADAPQAGTGIAVETNDGRTLHDVWRDDTLWGTRSGSFFFSLCEIDFDNDGDVDGSNLFELLNGSKILISDAFALEFGRKHCL